jgi:hypothetical protein
VPPSHFIFPGKVKKQKREGIGVEDDIPEFEELWDEEEKEEEKLDHL